MNKVFLSGNLTRDPEVRYTPSGKAYVKTGIAVQRRYKNSETGQYDVDFFNLTAWEKTAEFCGRYLRKGSRVLVEGKIQTSNYEGKDGVKRTGYDIWIDNIEFAGKGSIGGGDYSKSESRTDEDEFSKHDDDNMGTPISDDNVPF